MPKRTLPIKRSSTLEDAWLIPMKTEPRSEGPWAINRPFFRPNLSAIDPPDMAPMRPPTMAPVTAKLNHS